MFDQVRDSIVNKTKSPVPAEEGRETVRVLKEIVDQLESKYPRPLADARAHHETKDAAKQSAA